MKTPTIADVAKAAGVGKATVSRFLNNHPNVSDSARKKIEAAIAKTGYTNDPLVSKFLSGVRRQKIDSLRAVIGWINTYPTEDHWRREPSSLPFYEGVKEKAKESRMGFEEFWARDPDLTPARLHRILTARGIRALIIPPGSNVHEALPGFDWSSYAVSTVNPSSRENYQWHSVGTDGNKNAILMFSKLREAGYQRIGLVLQKGFSARDGHGMIGRQMIEPLIGEQPTPIQPLLYDGSLSSPKSITAFKNWIHNKPDVIVCLDDYIETLLAEEGLKVPEDVGLANVLYRERVSNWSGLARNTRDKGRAAVDLITMQISQNQYGIPEEPRQILISDNWVQGQTTRSI